jgi:hypothetical protein
MGIGMGKGKIVRRCAGCHKKFSPPKQARTIDTQTLCHSCRFKKKADSELRGE